MRSLLRAVVPVAVVAAAIAGGLLVLVPLGAGVLRGLLR